MTDKLLQDDLKSLTGFASDARGKRLKLPARAARASIASVKSVAEKTLNPSGPAQRTTGGGIASPLTETAITDRTYHAGKYWSTSDGVILWQAIDQIKFTDANGSEVIQKYKPPP